MFKQGSFEDEIYRSMEKTLVKNQTENRHGFNKLAKAVDYLNTAAKIFEQAGMSEQAEEVTQVLQELCAVTASEESIWDLPVWRIKYKFFHRGDFQSNPEWIESFTNVRANTLEEAIQKLKKESPRYHILGGQLAQAGRSHKSEQDEEFTKVLRSMSVNQLISEAFSLDDFMNKVDVLGINEQDLHNLLEMSSVAQLVNLAKKLHGVLKGDSTLLETGKELAKEHDITDPDVKDKLVSQIMTALKVAKFFV